MAKLRPAGDITTDLEPLLEELTDTHGLQHGEILALIHSWLKIHRPDSIEHYTDGTFPELKYGPKEIK